MSVASSSRITLRSLVSHNVWSPTVIKHSGLWTPTIVKYEEDQPREDNGRFGSSGDGSMQGPPPEGASLRSWAEMGKGDVIVWGRHGACTINAIDDNPKQPNYKRVRATDANGKNVTFYLSLKSKYPIMIDGAMPKPGAVKPVDEAKPEEAPKPKVAVKDLNDARKAITASLAAYGGRVDKVVELRDKAKKVERELSFLVGDARKPLLAERRSLKKELSIADNNLINTVTELGGKVNGIVDVEIDKQLAAQGRTRMSDADLTTRVNALKEERDAAILTATGLNGREAVREAEKQAISDIQKVMKENGVNQSVRWGMVAYFSSAAKQDTDTRAAMKMLEDKNLLPASFVAAVRISGIARPIMSEYNEKDTTLRNAGAKDILATRIALRDATFAVVGQLRPLAAPDSLPLKILGDAKATAMINKALVMYPADWVKTTQEKALASAGGVIKVMYSETLAGRSNAGGLRVNLTLGHESKNGDEAKISTILHEFQHVMDDHNKQLYETHGSYWRVRCPLQRTSINVGGNPGDPDEFKVPYSGVNYEKRGIHGWEIGTMGMEGLYGATDRNARTVQSDNSYRDYIIGTLLLASRR